MAATKTTKKTMKTKARTYVKVPKPKTKAEKAAKRAERSVELYGEFIDGWENQLDAIFDTSSDAFKKMMAIISTAKECKLDPEGNHRHHIVPRSYFNKFGKEVDNSENNLVTLTPAEHFIVHYYAWKAARKVMKTSMAYAFRLMYRLAGKTIEEQHLVAISSAFEAAWDAKMKRSKERAKAKKAATSSGEEVSAKLPSGFFHLEAVPDLGDQHADAWASLLGIDDPSSLLEPSL